MTNVYERDRPFLGRQKNAQTFVGKVEVHTANVFDNPQGREWETCVFRAPPNKEGVPERIFGGSHVVEVYSTWEEAFEGHKKWVTFFGENPDKGPEDVPDRSENPFGLLFRALRCEDSTEEE
jgi:hypothetical protein